MTKTYARCEFIKPGVFGGKCAIAVTLDAGQQYIRTEKGGAIIRSDRNDQATP